jgi:hypothetical protein
MTLRELTWHVNTGQKTAILLGHLPTDMRPSFIAKQNECGAFFNITTNESTRAQNSLQFGIEFSAGVCHSDICDLQLGLLNRSSKVKGSDAVP